MTTQLTRLINLSGSDAGFYILAIHSYIEGYLKKKFSGFDPEASFADNMYHMQTEFGRNSPSYLPALKNTFRHLRDEHFLTNRVRHEFAYITAEEARSATWNFLSFCELAGIDDPALAELRDSLELWDDRRSKMEIVKELSAKGFESNLRRLEIESLTNEIEEWKKSKAEEENLQKQIQTLNTQLDDEKTRADAKTEKAEKLRKERGELNRQLARLRKEIESHSEIESYLEVLKRLTNYTRTRLQYEQKILRLTPEQQKVLDQIQFNRDFLVKGGAGTGKTLVLLEALKRARAQEAGGLGLTEPGTYLLLTYTKTLAKYDQYISDIMNISGSQLGIKTVDSQLYRLLRKFAPQLTIDYGFNKSVLASLNTTDFLSDDLLFREIDDFLFGYGINEEEYIDQVIPRKGMKLPLSGSQRREVWKIRNQLKEKAVQQGRLSRNMAARFIHKNLELQENPGETDYIFIDESQDLPPVVLKVLKKLSRRAVIMAGDVDQSIYGIGSPYKRAGIDIRGNTRILKTNFRNPIPVHRLAENFRQLSDSIPFDTETQPDAFRDGPLPEIYTSDSVEELYKALVEKVSIFIGTLEYDPENICILAPTNRFLKVIAERLESENFRTVNIKDDGFEFSSSNAVRLSPMHSSKGLDFPVVLVFAPHLPGNDSLSDRTRDTLQRNLIYVSLTRAMDNLNVFIRNNPSEQPLKDLIRAFDEQEGK